MPGKINPVVPEAANQVAFRVFGLDTTVTFASEAGQLQLNAFEPLIYNCVREATQLLTSAMTMLERNCVREMSPNLAGVERNLANSTANATDAAAEIGYENASTIARLAIVSGLNWDDAFALWRSEQKQGPD